MMYLASQHCSPPCPAPLLCSCFPAGVGGGGDSEGQASGTDHAWRPHRFNKLAVGSVVESAFRRLKNLQVLDIEGNFEFGDVSKDRGRLEAEEDEEDEEDNDEEDEERR